MPQRKETARFGAAMTRSWSRPAAAFRMVLKTPQVAAISRALARLAEAGTGGYPPDVKRRLKILNLIAYLIAATTLCYAIQQSMMDFEIYKPVILLNLFLVATALAVPLMHRVSDIAGGLLIVSAEYLALLGFSSFFGRDAGTALQYIIAAAAPFVVFGLKRIWLVACVVVLGLALHIFAWFMFPPIEGLSESDRAIVDSLYVQGAVTTFGLIAASVYYAFSLAERAKAEIDTLLRNILPDSVVERLKARPATAIADSFEDASILFADITGFVPLSRRLGPARTVELLNRIVSQFDALAAVHGVEKIKTIGDAYMAAAGLPQRSPDHAERLAQMALDMLEIIERQRVETGLDLNVRIGFAAGPVMAGVIGTQKFSYDIWGDAVNLAARLESLGAPGRIHCCPSCRERLAGLFAFESCGSIDIKGVGRQETWFLIGPHQAIVEIVAEAEQEATCG